MTADVQRELAEICTCAGRTPPHGPLCSVPKVQRLIADAEKRAAAAALRDAAGQRHEIGLRNWLNGLAAALDPT